MDFRPQKIGKYLLMERIATGGMAEVYRAKASGASGFEKQLAIKRILPNYATNEEFRRMFEHEARLCSMLNHANIVQIYDFIKSGETYLLAMEFLDGKNLRQVLNKAAKVNYSIPIPLSIFLISEVCKGLDYAHKKRDELTGKPLNIIHRDMSPQNVMLSYDGAVKIVDFGIAKARGRVEETRSGVIKGKFGYMSPEQATGEEVDHRTDIFSTTIILYELLTGTRLFSADNDVAILKRIQECVVKRPTLVNPKVSEELEKIVLKGLAKSPDYRYQNAGDLHRKLQSYLNKHFPSFTSRDLGDIMHQLFSQEMAEEQKRLEQVYRQSIPFSQGAQGPTPATDQDINDLGLSLLDDEQTASENAEPTIDTSVDIELEQESQVVARDDVTESDGEGGMISGAAQRTVVADADSFSTEEKPVSLFSDEDENGEKESGEEEISESILEKTWTEKSVPKQTAPSTTEEDSLFNQLMPADTGSIDLKGGAVPEEVKKEKDTKHTGQAKLQDIDFDNLKTVVDAMPTINTGSTSDTFNEGQSTISKVSETKTPESLAQRMPSVSAKQLPLTHRIKEHGPSKRSLVEPDFSMKPNVQLDKMEPDPMYRGAYDSRSAPRPLVRKSFLRRVFRMVLTVFVLFAIGSAYDLVNTKGAEPLMCYYFSVLCGPTGIDRSITDVGDSNLPVAVPSQICTLQVGSDPPKALVYIADKTAGYTPTAISVPCQKAIDVRIELEGYETKQKNLVVKQKSQSLYETLVRIPYGRLKLTLSKNATVYVDGKKFTEAKANEMFLVPLRADKKYILRFENIAYNINVSKEYFVTKDSETEERVNLE